MKPQTALEEFTRMREQLKRIEQQITMSQQLFSHDITINNKSGEDLRFTIKVEDAVNEGESIDIQSKISVPNHTAVNHKIDEIPNFQRSFSQSVQNEKESNRKRNNLEETSYEQHLSISREYEQRIKMSSNRQEQRFQPISTLRANSQLALSGQKQQENEMPIHRKLNFHDQILVADDESQSQIGGNEQIEQLMDSKNANNPQMSKRKAELQLQESGQTTRRIDQQGTIPINLPFSIEAESKMQLYHTPHHRNTEKHEEDTTRAKKEELNWSMHSLERSSLKKPNQSLTNWKIDRTSPSTKRISPHIDYYQKTYAERSREKQIFAKNQRSREKGIKDSQYQSVVVEKQQKKAPSRVADDLFERRKSECLKKIDRERNYLNSIRKGSRERSISTKTINHQTKQQKKHPEKQFTMTSRIEQIGNRLHSSKSKSPCDHHNRFNQDQLRQNFNILVKQNPLVQRYVVHQQREQLFQRLRKEKDSISLWPMKIVNYTYSKLRKLSSYYQNTL